MRLKTDKGDLEAEEYWKEKVKNMPSFPKLNYQKKFAEVQNVRFDRIECSKRGKLLFNAITADIESMGHAISEQEKRQILVDILKKLC